MEEIKGLSAKDAYMLVRGSKKLETIESEKVYKNKSEPRKSSKRVDRKEGANKMTTKRKPQSTLTKTQIEFIKEQGLDASIYEKASGQADFESYSKKVGREKEFNNIANNSKNKRKRGK